MGVLLLLVGPEPQGSGPPSSRRRRRRRRRGWEQLRPPAVRAQVEVITSELCHSLLCALQPSTIPPPQATHSPVSHGICYSSTCGVVTCSSPCYAPLGLRNLEKQTASSCWPGPTSCPFSRLQAALTSGPAREECRVAWAA